MKKVLSYIIAALFLFIPVVAFAVEKIDIADYETMNFKQTLESENITIQNTNYKENDNQVVVYMFRGLGCGYCRSFLNFINSISEEYGDKFKLVSFEVWNNDTNGELLNAIGSFLEEPAEGVPYIIIGDQVFPGYAASYDDGIKNAIDTLYKTSKSERYDVFEAYNEELVAKERAEKSVVTKPIIWNFIFISIATIILVCYVSSSNKRLLETIKKENRNTRAAMEEEPKRKTTKK